MQLRDILYGHLTPNDPAASYRRLVALFPETDYAPPSDDHFDEAFLKGATRLKSASLSQRMAYFREYIATSQKARASDRLATSLDLEKVLANKLATAVRNAKNAKDEERAATQVYGVDRGPRAYQAIGRTFVEVLGDNAKKDRLLSLLERYPDVPEVVERVQRDGILRDREGHSVRVELGDAYDEIHALHGGRKENHVTRLDLTPAAFVGSKRNVPNATKRGLSAYAIDEDTRLLLQDGRVIRITMRHYEPERYHHGIRIGDTLDTLIQSLGEPDYTRSLMFGRQIATWRGLHGGSAEVSTVFDSGKVVIFYEQDTELTRQALARTWRKSE